MSEQARIEYDERRARARAWQRAEARRRLAEIHAGVGDHGEVSEADIDAVVDRHLDEQTDTTPKT